MRPRISTDFNRIKDAELLLKANTIIAAMTDNPNFPEPWPVQVPSLQVLRDAVAAFQTAVQDALTRDTTKILLRDKAWEYLIHQLLDLAPFVEMIAKGDVNMLMSSGFDLCKERTHTGCVEAGWALGLGGGACWTRVACGARGPCAGVGTVGSCRALGLRRGSRRAVGPS